jgi:hypothetical protein
VLWYQLILFEAEMAKKKPTPAQTGPEPARSQLSIINLKGTEAYRDWLAGFTKATHITAATLFRLGMAEMAQKYEYPDPPEK